MKVLLTGGKGMLGRTLCRELTDFTVIPTDLPEADITDLAGFDALLKAERPDALTIPIIAFTANAFDEDVQNSLQAGLNAHLSKPVEPDALYETLESLIKA